MLVIAVSTSVYALVPPLIDGIERKIKAKIQSRIGPSTILQTWYDIFKLLLKGVVLPIETSLVSYILALLLTLIIMAAYTVSYLVTYSVSNFVYVALLLVLLASIHGLSVILYIVYSNPFSIIGTFRILLLDVLNESALIVFFILGIVAIRVEAKPVSIPLSTLSILALTVLSYVLSRRLPYDLHEAEPELASGSLIEFSGPFLAAYLYGFIVKRYLYTSLPVVMALLLVNTDSSILNVVLLHATTIVVYLAHSVINTILARSRIDLAIKTLTFLYLVILALSLIICLVLRT